MNCEKCPIKEECEKEKLAYFEGKRITSCPLVNAAHHVTDTLEQRAARKEFVIELNRKVDAREPLTTQDYNKIKAYDIKWTYE